MDKKSLKRMVKTYDSDVWRRELEDKSSTEYYRAEKKEIRYETCYTNDYSSKIYAKARMNALQLEKQKGKKYKDYNTTCKLCGEEEEEIIHFTVKCKILEGKRNIRVINKNIKDPEERMKDFLFRNKEYAEVRKVIRDLWVLRNKKLKELEKNLTTEERDEKIDGSTTENQPKIRSQGDPSQKSSQERRKGHREQKYTPMRGTTTHNNYWTW